MNLTINQIQELGELEKQIQELTAKKTSLQSQVALAGQNNQTKLESVFNTTFNNALTLRSQALTTQNIAQLANWERDNINDLYEQIKKTYLDFLGSSQLSQMFNDFVKEYKFEENKVFVELSSDLENKVNLQGLTNFSISTNSNLDPMSLIFDFGEVLVVDMSFDSIKDELVPKLSSHSITI